MSSAPSQNDDAAKAPAASNFLRQIIERDLAEGRLERTTAVVASRTAAQLYHLEIMAEDIQTDHDNRTKFMVFTKHD